MNAAMLIPFILYFVPVLVIGIYARKFSSRGITEFFIGGRQMNSFVVAVSSVVSGRSAWLLLVFTAQAYSMGLAAIWAIIGYIVVEFFLFLFYAPRLRNYTGNHDCITIPDFYAHRFRDYKGILRFLLIIIFMVSMLSYVAFQFAEGGKVFYTNFDIDQTTGILLTAFIVLFYTLLGGFMAANLSDVLQAFVMLLAMIIIPLYTVLDLGGFSEVHSRMASLDQEFFSPLALSTGALTGLLGFGLGSSGNPNILVKYMSIKNPQQFKWVAITGTALSILFALGAMSIGIMAKIYFPNIESLPGKDPANAFLTLTQAVLPSVFMGIFLASLFSAIISTADSQLLVTASALVRDLYQKFLQKKKIIMETKLIFLSRLAVVLLVYLAILPGLLFENGLTQFVLFVWAALGASVGPTSILALFWKKTTRKGVFAGLITGIVTAAICELVPFIGSLTGNLIPGFVLAWIVTMSVSLLIKDNSKYDDIKKVSYSRTRNFKPRFEE